MPKWKYCSYEHLQKIMNLPSYGGPEIGNVIDCDEDFDFTFCVYIKRLKVNWFLYNM